MPTHNASLSCPSLADEDKMRYVDLRYVGGNKTRSARRRALKGA